MSFVEPDYEGIPKKLRELSDKKSKKLPIEETVKKLVDAESGIRLEMFLGFDRPTPHLLCQARLAILAALDELGVDTKKLRDGSRQ